MKINACLHCTHAGESSYSQCVAYIIGGKLTIFLLLLLETLIIYEINVYIKRNLALPFVCLCINVYICKMCCRRVFAITYRQQRKIRIITKPCGCLLSYLFHQRFAAMSRANQLC